MNDYFELWFGLIALAAFLAVAAIVSSVQCSSRWGHSGLETSWGPIQGCLVKIENGRWIPDDRVREVDLSPKAKP